MDGCGGEAVGVGCEHGLPCVGEGFGCRDECDDAVGVVGVHGLSSRCGCATPIDLLYNLQGDLRNIFASVDIDFSLESGWKAADREPIRASVATLVFPTKSPLNWARARWPEGSLFGHWRSGVTFAQISCGSTRRGVREHPAPSGALRLGEVLSGGGLAERVREHPAPSGALRRDGRRRESPPIVREHPAPSGALRPGHRSSRMRNRLARGQGAPSTIRCIKTGQPQAESDELLLGQGAPSTIRCIKTKSCAATGHRGSPVREHPAPSGALRRDFCSGWPYRVIEGQGAPSTIRCIKTLPLPFDASIELIVREHPAPSGVLRRSVTGSRPAFHLCQGAPSTIRCIKTGGRGRREKRAPPRQGAPSTIRCIKTSCPGPIAVGRTRVREHPAPSGALRHGVLERQAEFLHRQGAPSTIRCIETRRG